MRDRGFQASERTKHLRAELANLKSIAESCSRQLRAWAESLQNTDIKGQRHLTRAHREQYDAARRAEAFWKQVDALVEARLIPPGGAHD